MVRHYMKTAETLFDQKKQDGTVARIYEYLYSHYRTATLDTASRDLGYSKNYLCRLISKHTEKTFCGLLNEVRISEAKKLLIEEKMKISEVGSLVGYNPMSIFTAALKSWWASLPKNGASSRMNDFCFSHAGRGENNMSVTAFFQKTLDKQKIWCYNSHNLIETVEAEITSIMTSQRACVGASQVGNSSANGPLRVQGKERFALSILQRVVIRQLTGICLYLAERTKLFRESRWYRGYCTKFVHVRP